MVRSWGWVLPAGCWYCTLTHDRGLLWGIVAMVRQFYILPRMVVGKDVFIALAD